MTEGQFFILILVILAVSPAGYKILEGFGTAALVLGGIALAFSAIGSVIWLLGRAMKAGSDGANAVTKYVRGRPKLVRFILVCNGVLASIFIGIYATVLFLLVAVVLSAVFYAIWMGFHQGAGSGNNSRNVFFYGILPSAGLFSVFFTYHRLKAHLLKRKATCVKT